MLIYNNTINGNNKTRRCNKARFLKKTPSSGKSLISTYLRFFGWEPGRDQKGGWRLFEFEFEGGEVGWGWALIKFFCLQDWSLFEVGANSRLGAYSNKYGSTMTMVWKGQRGESTPFCLRKII